MQDAAVFAHRVQFGFTIMFHYLFPMAVLIVVVITTIATLTARANALRNFQTHPLTWLAPVLAMAGIISGFLCRRADRDHGAFRSSTLLIVALMACAACTIYPNLLTSTINPAYSLTIYNAASSPLALRASFIANAVGMIGVVVYSVYVHRVFRGKVRPDSGHY